MQISGMRHKASDAEKSSSKPNTAGRQAGRIRSAAVDRAEIAVGGAAAGVSNQTLPRI